MDIFTVILASRDNLVEHRIFLDRYFTLSLFMSYFLQYINMISLHAISCSLANVIIVVVVVAVIVSTDATATSRVQPGPSELS